jgi:hypothetical protein
MSGIEVRVRFASGDKAVRLGTHPDPERLAAQINVAGGFDTPEYSGVSIDGIRWLYDPDAGEAYCELVLTDPDSEE